MRVGIFTHYIDKYPRSAPSLYQKELIERLLKRNNIELVLIHHKKSDHRIYRLAEEAIISKIPYKREKEIEKLDLDLIHFNAIPWSWWPSISKLNIPTIATVHGTIHWDDPRLDDYSNTIFRNAKKILEKRVVKSIIKFIAVSSHVKNVLIEKLNVSPSRVSVVYLPIDHTTFKPLEEKAVQETLRKYSISTKYILHVSAFSKRKNPLTLLKSFQIVKQHINNLTLVIVGSGWDNALVKNIINKLRLNKDIKILGWIPKDGLVALYNGASALLFTSFHENFGFPIVEAMACGCPVITSNAYAIPEIAGNAALLCSPRDCKCFADAILRVMTDHYYREELVKKSLMRAKLFNWNKHINEIMNIYRKVIDSISDRND